jgi:plastocyanin
VHADAGGAQSVSRAKSVLYLVMAKRLALGALLSALVVFAFAGAANAQSAPVSVGMMEFAFQPSTINVGSTSVTFSAHNDGQFPHNIAIDGRDGSVFANDLTSGQSATATITLAPGTYTFYCPVDGHRDRGMVGTLTVASAQAARAGDLDPTYLSAGLAVLGVALIGGGYLRRRGLI